MSPRPKKLRKISKPPVISGFKPYGNKNAGPSENVFLHYEEYEAIRLCDFEMLNHHKASVIMDVSRPTLTRIYARARQKIAEALVKGCQIIIEGGKTYFDSEWFKCNNCACYFNHPDKEEPIKECPLCASHNFINYEQSGDETEESDLSCDDICICPACNYEQQHRFGHPCKDETCPECGNLMVRKESHQSRNQRNTK